MTGGARLETENLSAINEGVVAMEANWVSSVKVERSGSS